MCNNCLLKKQIAAELEAESEDSQRRKDLIRALEEAGVSLPISQFEMVLECGACSPIPSTLGGSVLPEDIQALLKKHAQLRAEGKSLTDIEEARTPEKTEQIRLPRAPFGATKQRGAVLMEDDMSVETSTTSSSKMVTASPKSRITVVYPKRRKLRWAILVCCLLQALLIALIVYFTMDAKKRDTQDRFIPAGNDTLANGEFVGGAGSSGTDGVDGNGVDGNGVDGNGTTDPDVDPNCENKIVTNAACYYRGEQIVVSLANCNPEKTDWIGIFDSTGNLDDLPSPASWMWTCGNKECTGEVRSNTVAFRDVYEPGVYRVAMLRLNDDDDSPDVAYESSEIFRVEANALDCA